MKKLIFVALGAALLLGGAGPKEPQGWVTLLDNNLSQWQTYESYRYQLGYMGKVPTDAQGRPVPPIGYGKNEANVFSVVMQDGEPVLRISGEIYGCVFTRQDFVNYDLILYNSQGKCGVDYWHSWMLGQEFQVSEYKKGNAMGDYWCIANSAADIMTARSATRDTLKYDPLGASVAMGNGGPYFCQAAANYELPNGQWNELELINVNGQSVHLVNGHVVLAVRNSSAVVNGQRQPLTHGKIQLQSEAAEVFYKGIMIKPLDVMPVQYARYFGGR